MSDKLSELNVLSNLLNGASRLAQAAVDLQSYENGDSVKAYEIIDGAHKIMIKAEKAMNDYFDNRNS